MLIATERRLFVAPVGLSTAPPEVVRSVSYDEITSYQTDTSEHNCVIIKTAHAPLVIEFRQLGSEDPANYQKHYAGALLMILRRKVQGRGSTQAGAGGFAN